MSRFLRLSIIPVVAVLKVISRRLRHSTPCFTAKAYGDVLPELARDAAEATAAIVPLRQRRAEPA
ncbi:hypothetical protein V6V89_32360 [Micromonospora sp. CPCC 206061]